MVILDNDDDDNDFVMTPAPSTAKRGGKAGAKPGGHSHNQGSRKGRGSEPTGDNQDQPVDKNAENLAKEKSEKAAQKKAAKEKAAKEKAAQKLTKEKAKTEKAAKEKACKRKSS